MSEALSTAAARWPDRRMLAFDLESTGVDIETARIVTACIARVGGGLPTEKTSWLVDPGVEIPAEATAVHGVTTEKARAEGRIARVAVLEICEAIYQGWRDELPVVAMNASYDLSLLDRELRRHGHAQFLVNGGPVIDPFVLDKHLDRFRRGSRKLTALCEHYQAKLDGAHDAAFDAIAAARVAYRIGKRYREVGELDLWKLHLLQKEWFAEQAESLEAYFRKQGKTEPVSREWPMRTWRPAT